MKELDCGFWYSDFPAPNSEGEPPQIDKRSVIDPSCTIKPEVEIINSVIGPNCFIKERARIENPVLLAGARIGRATEVRGSLIGRYAKVEDSVLSDKSSLTDYSTV